MGGDPPHKLMTRLILHCAKLQFTPGFKAQEFVQRTFEISMEDAIHLYIKEKYANASKDKLDKTYHLVTQTLRKMSNK